MLLQRLLLLFGGCGGVLVAWQDNRYPPAAPALEVISKTWTSIQVQWTPGSDGGDPIRGYKLMYRAQEEVSKTPQSWQDRIVPASHRSCILMELLCGTTYELYVTAFNDVGNGDASDVATVTTDHDDLPPPPEEDIVKEDNDSVTFHLQEWQSDCPIDYFSVEYKAFLDDSENWIVASRKLGAGLLTISDLSPATWYKAKVTAFASGFTSEVKYHFPTLNAEGEFPAPPRDLLIEKNETWVEIELHEWRAKRDCPIDHFQVEYKTHGSDEWTVVSNHIGGKEEDLMIGDLSPGTWYTLQINVVLCGGRTTGVLYTFETLGGGDDSNSDEGDHDHDHDEAPAEDDSDEERGETEEAIRTSPSLHQTEEQSDSCWQPMAQPALVVVTLVVMLLIPALNNQA